MGCASWTLLLPPAPYYSVLMDGCLERGADLSKLIQEAVAISQVSDPVPDAGSDSASSPAPERRTGKKSPEA